MRYRDNCGHVALGAPTTPPPFSPWTGISQGQAFAYGKTIGTYCGADLATAWAPVKDCGECCNYKTFTDWATPQESFYENAAYQGCMYTCRNPQVSSARAVAPQVFQPIIRGELQETARRSTSALPISGLGNWINPRKW